MSSGKSHTAQFGVKVWVLQQHFSYPLSGVREEDSYPEDGDSKFLRNMGTFLTRHIPKDNSLDMTFKPHNKPTSILMRAAWIFYCFYCNQSINQCKIKNHKSISLYNMYSYMFRHLCFIIRKVYICTLLSYINS